MQVPHPCVGGGEADHDPGRTSLGVRQTSPTLRTQVPRSDRESGFSAVTTSKVPALTRNPTGETTASPLAS
jgi:hypothetical protein